MDQGRGDGACQDRRRDLGLDAAMAAVGDRWTLFVVDALLDGPGGSPSSKRPSPRWPPTCSPPGCGASRTRGW